MARYNRTSAAGGWLSRLERVLDMHEVTGSSPVPPTTLDGSRTNAGSCLFIEP